MDAKTIFADKCTEAKVKLSYIESLVNDFQGNEYADYPAINQLNGLMERLNKVEKYVVEMSLGVLGN